MAASVAEKPAEAAKPAEAQAPAGGGAKAMLPLIVNLVLMPAIAFAMTQFVILPKLNSKAAGEAHGDAAATEAEAGAAAEHGDAKADKAHGETKAEKAHGEEAKADKGHGDAKGEKAEKGHDGAKPAKGGKILAPLSSKLIVNVAGTMGTRYLVAGITLVGTKPNLKELVEANDSQLRDVASAALASKSIVDLERPGARNIIRGELVSVFNSVLGENVVQEIYLTEFAVQ
jgi:flagellar protein FliL